MDMETHRDNDGRYPEQAAEVPGDAQHRVRLGDEPPRKAWVRNKTLLTEVWKVSVNEGLKVSLGKGSNV